MGVELFEHNQETYANIVRLFASENRVGIVQPTGTGKSFLYLKWVEDHPNERFVILSPSNEIFTQLEDYASESGGEDLIRNTEMITYQTLLHMADDQLAELCADKIIIDEFHRAGAELWGPALQRLLEANPEAKILGATATPIRYLDEAKDMALELFDNNLAGYMTLGEAVAKGVLPTPHYVPVWYDVNGKLDRYQRDIFAVSDPKERQELEKQLRDLKKNLQNAYGASEVFQKNMPTDHGKYIVFCRDYEHLQEMQKTMVLWLAPVNRNVHSYVSISREVDRDVQLDVFRKDDDGQAIKLLFTIDRLNEGVHVKGIDGVIMLRPTTSPIIYLQQMGRALASGQKQPVIFDMVNNYQNVQIPTDDGKTVNAFQREFDGALANNFTSTNTASFKVFQQMLRFTELFRSLEDNLYLNSEQRWQKNFELLKAYIQEFGVFPVYHTQYKGVALASWLTKQKSSEKAGTLSRERKELLESIGFSFENNHDECWRKNFELLKAYTQEFGVFPAYQTRYKGVSLSAWLAEQKSSEKAGALSPDRRELLEGIGFSFEASREANWQKNFELLKAYTQEFGVFPAYQTQYKGVSLGDWLTKQKSSEKAGTLSRERKELLESTGFSFKDSHEERWQKNFELLKAYIQEFGVFPSQKIRYKGFALGAWLRDQKSQIKAGTLSYSRKHALEDAGFVVARENTQKRSGCATAVDSSVKKLPLAEQIAATQKRVPGTTPAEEIPNSRKEVGKSPKKGDVNSR